jgi:hypothetical protein
MIIIILLNNYYVIKYIYILLFYYLYYYNVVFAYFLTSYSSHFPACANFVIVLCAVKFCT